MYAVAELSHGYGSLAVFIAGLPIRFSEETGEEGLLLRLHDFVSEVERLLLAIFHVLFGGCILNGLLNAADWRTWFFFSIFLFGIRPLTGYLNLAGSSLDFAKKIAVSFLGIRGIGSWFYLSWALPHAEFPEKDKLYVILGVIISISLVAHGFSAQTILKWANPQQEDQRNYELEGDITGE